ncbi:hypothetical protein ABZP36_007134 [Zizania latifolia]
MAERGGLAGLGTFHRSAFPTTSTIGVRLTAAQPPLHNRSPLPPLASLASDELGTAEHVGLASWRRLRGLHRSARVRDSAHVPIIEMRSVTLNFPFASAQNVIVFRNWDDAATALLVGFTQQMSG